MKYRLLFSIITLCVLTTQAWGRTPGWMVEEVAPFVEFCLSASSDEIETMLKKCSKVQRSRYLGNSNGKGETALSAALQYNSDPNTVNVLIKYGADPKHSLKDAIDEKNRSAVSALLNAYPDTINGLNFIDLCSVGPYKMIEDKLKNGEAPNAYGLGSRAPLHVAVEDNPDPAVANLLIEYGADPDAAKLLQHAALGGNINIIVALLNGKVPVDIKDKEGQTALMVAAAQSGMNICCKALQVSPEELAIKGITALLQAGADVNAKSNRGRTALIEAANWGRIETVRLLLKAGADVNIQTIASQTALIEAVTSTPHPEVIIALLDAGADVNIKDGYGKRAIDYARQHQELAGTEAFLRLVKASR